jgi:predicted transposase YbfD/YdcC
MSSRLVAVFTPFEDLTDPRVERSRRHELFELVVVALCGTLAGSDTWADIERFGNARIEWLRTFLRLKNGIPSHDTFGRVFSRLDPAGLLACIQQWLDEIGLEVGKHIAIDGKTLRGSFDKAAGKNPLHLVSAWACEARLTLGQVATDAKSNEITAIPLLLELLDVKGATVTIDAMGCQKEIAEKIVEREGDYLLALKENHPKLCEAVAAEFTAALEADVPPRELRRHVTVETNRGRRERREYFALPGSKHHLLVDGGGVPLQVETSAANVPDVNRLLPLVVNVPAVRGKPGRPRSRPDRLYADRGYDAEAARELLRWLGIEPCLAKRNTEHGSGLGKYRYVVERTISWFRGFRRLRVRYDRSECTHNGFFKCAACLICLAILL